MRVQKMKPATAIDNPDALAIMQLASSAGLDSSRIRRLIEKWRNGSHHGSPPPFPMLKWGMQYLLNFSAEKALDILESADPVRVVERLSFISRVNDPHDVVLTLEELGTITRGFLDFVEGQRTSLIETGYPRIRFDTSFWHDWRLTDLYRTKIPQSVVMSVKHQGKGSKRDPHARERGILDYTWSPTPTSHPFPPDLWTGSLFALNMPREYRVTAFNPPPQDTRVPSETAVSYAEAPYMRGFSLNQAYVMETGRQYVFNAKHLILQELCKSLSSDDPDAVWDQCFGILKEALSQWEIRSFMALDRPSFLDAYGKQLATGAQPVGPITGGLNSLYNVIWHFESELRVGPMRKVREVLGDAVLVGSDGTRSFRKTAGWLSDGDINRIDEAMTLFERLDKEKHQHVENFDQRLRQDIKKMTYATVVASVKVPVGKKDDLQEVMDKYARFFESSTRSGIPIPTVGQQDGSAEKPTGRYVFRREGDFWRLSYEGKNITIKQSLGMEYLWLLLMSPWRPIGLFPLHTIVTGEFADARDVNEADPDRDDDDSAHATRIRTPGDGVLQQADIRYAGLARERLSHIGPEIETARRKNDRQSIRILQQEKRLLWESYNENRPQTSRGGRAEARDNDLEKLRKSVRKNVFTSISNIRDLHQAMGAHLHISIKITRSCVYAPDRNIQWILR